MTAPTAPDMTPAWAPGDGCTGHGAGDRSGGHGSKSASEQIRWIQDCLNRVMSAQLPIDGVMSEDVRNIVRSFQQQQNLTVTGIVGPDTAAALQAACSGGQPAAAAPPDAPPAPDAAWRSAMPAALPPMRHRPTAPHPASSRWKASSVTSSAGSEKTSAMPPGD